MYKITKTHTFVKYTGTSALNVAGLPWLANALRIWAPSLSGASMQSFSVSNNGGTLTQLQPGAGYWIHSGATLNWDLPDYFTVISESNTPPIDYDDLVFKAELYDESQRVKLEKMAIGGTPQSGAAVTLGSDGKLRFESRELPNFTIEDNTIVTDYPTLRATMAANQLSKGRFYQFRFQTVHNVPYTDNVHLNVQGVLYAPPSVNYPNSVPKTDWAQDESEGYEDLIVLAVTGSAISSAAYSVQHPGDTITYDPYLDVCEDGTTPRRGAITYRKDTGRNIDAQYDFRHTWYIRYAVNPAAYSSAATHNRHATVLHDDAVYGCLLNGTTGIAPSNTGQNWVLLFPYGADPWGSTGIQKYFGIKAGNLSIGSFSVPVDTTKFIYVHTFSKLVGVNPYVVESNLDDPTLHDFSIGAADRLPNLAFVRNFNSPGWAIFSGNKIGANNYDSTFGRNFNNNDFGSTCENNIALVGLSGTTMQSYGSRNFFAGHNGEHNDTITFGTDFSSNCLLGGYNTSYFGGQCRQNIIRGRVVNCEIGSGYADNTHLDGLTGVFTAGSVYGNTWFKNIGNINLSQRVSDSIFKGEWLNSSISRPFMNKVVEEDCVDVHFTPGTSLVPLTQAEYDALPQAKKDDPDTVYAIKST